MRGYRLPTSPLSSGRVGESLVAPFHGLMVSTRRKMVKKNQDGVEGDYEYELYLLQRKFLERDEDER